MKNKEKDIVQASGEAISVNPTANEQIVPPTMTKEEIANKRRNQIFRVYTGVTLILILALSLLLREITVYFFDVLLLVLLVACVYDILKTKNVKGKGIKEYFIYGYLIVAYIVFFVGTIVTPAFSIWGHLIAQFIVFFVWALYLWFMQYVDKPFIKHCKLKRLSLGKECNKMLLQYCKLLLYPIFAIFALFALNHIGVGTPEAVNIGLFALLLVFVTSAATDTFAYAVGSLLRGPKLLPEKMRYISPNKTWSGAIGGLFGGVLGALTLILIFSGNTAFSDFMTQQIGYATAVIIVFAIIGMLASVVTQIGDIFASYIKRKNGIKDFGNYLPGHGGAMDRVDGIIFNAVFIFFVMLIITSI